MENLNIGEKDFIESFLTVLESTKNKIYEIPKNKDFSDASIINNFDIEKNEISNIPELLKIGELIPKKYENNLKFSIPAIIPFSTIKGICFYVNELNKEIIKNLIQKISIRLLCSTKINNVKIHAIFPNSFEKDFNLLNKLSHNYFGDKVLSSSKDIDKFLIKMIGKSIEFSDLLKKENLENIEQYNEKFKDNPKCTNVILISNFPSGFNEKSCLLLLDLLKNIDNTGTHIIMSLDVGVKQPYTTDFLEKLLSLMIGIYQEKGKYFKIKNLSTSNIDESLFNEKFNLILDLNMPENIEKIIYNLNYKTIIKEEVILDKEIITQDQIEELNVDISELIPSKNWIVDTLENITIPIGKNSKNDIVSILLGKDKEEKSEINHAIIAGIKGSGKKTLLHNIINISSAIYSPEELQFLLLDYKKGTEFKVYKNLPHISLFEKINERASGLNIIEQLNEEIKKRELLFNKFKEVSNFTSYRKVSGKVIPRILAIIHNFEVFPNVKNEVFKEAKALLDNIIKIGDKFGINVIISTNEIKNLELDNLSSLGIKIALKMSEEESILILDKKSASLLNKGQAIYSSKNSNSDNKFFFPYINTEIIQSLIRKLTVVVKTTKVEEKVLEKQNTIDIYKNTSLLEHIKNNNFTVNKDFCDVFIGSQDTKEDSHIFFRLRRQIESNLIIIGKDLSSAFSILGISLYQIIKQSTNESKFYILDLFNVDSGFKGNFDFLKSYTDNCNIGESRNIESFINEIVQELDNRLEEYNNKNRIILVIANLQNARKKLDQKSTSPIGRKLMKILSEGPEVGIHTFLYSENYSTFESLIDSQFLSEFENKISIKGGESLNILEDPSSLNITSNGYAILQCPYLEDNNNIFKVYEFKDFLEITENE
jgi:S-DNA-T family DNA segregation ATPase FtsK/SpoIIIE